MVNNKPQNNKWYALILASLTMAFAIMMPEMGITVLFKEISEDLNLNFVQIGTVWGIVPLGSVTFLFIGGILCDRFGVKNTITTACFVVGIAGALRGVSTGINSLVFFSFIFGMLASIIPISAFKACRLWFPNEQLGLANSIITTGSGIGAAASTMFSATFFSPLLGGWRNVMFFYGAASILLGVLWLFTIKENRHVGLIQSEKKIHFRRIMISVLGNKTVWLLGINLFTYIGSMQAIAGYLPLYLIEIGWPQIQADGALTVLTISSIVGAIPLAMLSDRLARKKAILIPGILVPTICTAILPVSYGAYLWIIVIILGIFRRSYLAITNSVVLQTKGISVAQSGMAMGLVITLQRIGIFIASPIGNSLADFNLGLPFVFWAALLGAGTIILIFTRETQPESPDF